MKLNRILLVTYIILTLIFTPIWFIIQPSNEPLHYVENSPEITYLKVGEQIPIDYHKLRKAHDYNRIELIDVMREGTQNINHLSDQSEPMFYQNHRYEYFSNRHGLAIYTLILYKDERIVSVINLGYHLQYVEYDANDHSWIPLNQTNFMRLLEENPNGKFFLEENIELHQRRYAIPIFTGILMNPYHMKISKIFLIDTEIDQGLFRVIDNAIIDGIIIEQSRFRRLSPPQPYQTSYIGFISSHAFGSFVSNVSVNGEIDYDHSSFAGGLVGSSIQSVYHHVSFTGNIHNSFSTGGILGSHQSIRMFPQTFMYSINTPVYTIQESYVDAEFTVASRVGGLVGNIQYQSLFYIRNIYVTGSTDFNEYKHLNISYGYLARDFFNEAILDYHKAYVTYPIYDDRQTIDGDLVIFITEEDLFTEEPLEGLESYIFSTDDIPRLSYWRIGS
jgi:hypothetical protein